MRDPYQVLHEKQMDLLRLRKETAALRLVAAMLADEQDECNLHPLADSACVPESSQVRLRVEPQKLLGGSSDAN